MWRNIYNESSRVRGGKKGREGGRESKRRWRGMPGLSYSKEVTVRVKRKSEMRRVWVRQWKRNARRIDEECAKSEEE